MRHSVTQHSSDCAVALKLCRALVSTSKTLCGASRPTKLPTETAAAKPTSFRLTEAIAALCSARAPLTERGEG
eukprot:5048511-Pleurochrysis_carterae.AAC.2